MHYLPSKNKLKHLLHSENNAILEDAARVTWIRPALSVRFGDKISPRTYDGIVGFFLCSSEQDEILCLAEEISALCSEDPTGKFSTLASFLIPIF
jgi:hypothetical protein